MSIMSLLTVEGLVSRDDAYKLRREWRQKGYL